MKNYIIFINWDNLENSVSGESDVNNISFLLYDIGICSFRHPAVNHNPIFENIAISSILKPYSETTTEKEL